MQLVSIPSHTGGPLSLSQELGEGICGIKGVAAEGQPEVPAERGSEVGSRDKAALSNLSVMWSGFRDW